MLNGKSFKLNRNIIIEWSSSFFFSFVLLLAVLLYWNAFHPYCNLLDTLFMSYGHLFNWKWTHVVKVDQIPKSLYRFQSTCSLINAEELLLHILCLWFAFSSPSTNSGYMSHKTFWYLFSMHCIMQTMCI